MGQVSTTLTIVDKSSKKLRKINIQLEAMVKAFDKVRTNSSSASSGITKFTTSLNTLESSANQVGLTLYHIAGVAESTGNRISNAISSSASTVKSSTSSMQISIKSVSKAMQSDGIKAINDYKNALKNSVKHVGTFNSAIKTIKKEVSITSPKIKSFTSDIKSLGESAKVTGEQLNTVSTNATKLSNTKNGFSSQIAGADGLTRSLKRLAKAYLGVMTAKATLEASDKLTSANNRLVNYGVSEGGMSTTQAEQFSKDTQEKMFNAAQNSLSEYSVFMSNTSKMLTSASDAFGDTFEKQVDNAIVFQETMSKAFALNGATGSEISSVLTQIPQALASDSLQGDELKAIRENAPLLAKGIEDFANKILKTDKSIKQLGKDGQLTGRMVVAAILDMAGETEKAFEYVRQNMTFSQIWTQFKNESLKAFTPFLEKLREVANSDAFQFLVDKTINGVRIIAWALSGLMNVVQSVLNFIQNHWNFVRGLIVAGVLILIWLVGSALKSAFLKVGLAIGKILLANPKLLILIGIISLIVMWTGYLIETLGSVSKALAVVAITIGAIMLLVGALMLMVQVSVMGVAMVVIGIILIVAGIFFDSMEEMVGRAYQGFEYIKNALKWVGNHAVAVFNVIVGWVKFLYETSYATGEGIANVGKAVMENLKSYTKNAILEMCAKFLELHATASEVFKGILEKANSVLGVFGFEIDTSMFDAAIENSRRMAENIRDAKDEVPDLKQVFAESFKDIKLPDTNALYQAGLNTWEYGDTDAAYEKGYQKGADIRNAIDGLKDKFSLDKIAGEGLNGVVTGSDPESLLNGAGGTGLDDAVTKNTGKTADNTGDISKSMDLAEDDLKYLRQIAEKEATNKFTTAEIKVEMNNNNTVNNTNDLDGIVTTLSKMLKEELQVVADGVHA